MAEDLKETPESGVIQNLFGTGDENMQALEKLLEVRVSLRGGEIVV